MKDIYEKSIYTPYHKDKLLAFYHKYEFNQMIKNIDKRKGLITTEKRKDDKLIVENITSINNLKNIRGITFVSNNDNENIAELLGFALLADKVYFLPLNYAYEDEKFKEYLNSPEQKITYDLKSLYVFLERYSFPKVKNVYFDLLLATYLLNPDVGQSRDEIFSNYSISLGEEKYCSSLYYTGKLEKETIKKLQDNDQLSLLNNIEIPLSEILASMEIEGVPVDKKTLEDINKEYSDIIEKYKESIYADAGLEFNINSPKVLEDVLFNKLNIYRRKGEKGTNIEVLNRHIDDHPIINKIIAYRTYNKIVSSYTSSLPKHIFKDNKIHAIYNQALTATGRLSMSEPNLQNISIKNELGKNIRKAFFYPDDNYFLSLDYSQIELRVLASIGNILAYPFYPVIGELSWASTVSALLGLVAKEQVVSSMSVIAGLAETVEDGSLIFAQNGIFGFFTPLSAYSYMVFVLFSAPCIGAIGAMRREFKSLKTTFKAVAYQTLLAYILASLITGVGSLIMLFI